MKTRFLKSSLAAATSLVFLIGNASAQEQDREVPTITFDAPATGVDLAAEVDTPNPDFFSRGRVTVSGTATEETSLRGVQYRLEGSKRWRNATVIRTNNGIDAGTAGSYVWSFRMSVKRRSDRRVFVRAVDSARNESDIIGRKVIRR